MEEALTFATLLGVVSLSAGVMFYTIKEYLMSRRRSAAERAERMDVLKARVSQVFQEKFLATKGSAGHLAATMAEEVFDAAVDEGWIDEALR